MAKFLETRACNSIIFSFRHFESVHYVSPLKQTQYTWLSNSFQCWKQKSRHEIFSVIKDFRLRLKCDGTRAETRFRLSAKRMSLFKSAGVSVQSTTGSRDVFISGSNTGYTMFRGGMKSTGYTLHSPVFPSLPLPCITVCHHISTGLYQNLIFTDK
jgi:hypothetical protein